MERNTEIFNFFVGREKKGQGVFLPLCFLRGFEGVQKSETDKSRMRTGAAVRSGSLGVEDFLTSAGIWPICGKDNSFP